jgi:segregation and condensation protein A
LTTASPSFTLPTFEGPLDLLLHLIRENRVDIYDIPVALIASQYLEYLSDWKARDLTVAGEYLVMAATLVEMKTRLLLPQPPAPDADEDDPRAELVLRLLEYQRYAGVVAVLRQWEEYRSAMYFRGALENPDDYMLPIEAGALRGPDLVMALRRLLDQAGLEEAEVSAVVPRRRVSLQMSMVTILRAITSAPEGLAFSALFGAPADIAEVVLAFLAVLELLRRGRIEVVQRRPLSDFRLRAARAGSGTCEAIAP